MIHTLVVTYKNTSDSSVNYHFKENTDRYFLFEVSKSLNSIFNAYLKFLSFRKRYDVALVNYVSLFILFGLFLKILGMKIVFVPHEGEPLFPDDYKNKISGFRRLISVPFFTKLCILLSDKTLFLSNLQAIKITGSTSVDIIRFSSNTSFYCPVVPWDERASGLFFPNRRSEPIKGWMLISNIHRYFINTSAELSSDDMRRMYASSRYVVIPSVIESYSFALVEALLSNCVVLTTKNVGLAQDMLAEYGFEYLVNRGLYVFDNVDDISEFYISELANKMWLRKEPLTRNLAINFGLCADDFLKNMDTIINRVMSV